MKRIGIFLLASTFLLASCNKDGCIDPTAINYDPNAESDDGSCVYLAQNLEFTFCHKLGAQPFSFDQEAQSASGRMVKFTRAQMYLSGFTFNGSGGSYTPQDPYLLIRPGVENYPIGYLPEDSYTSFHFSVGVDSVANHADPATFPSASALSSNNPNHMHWGWNTGYIFIVLEGLVDTTTNMNGEVNAPFIFHVGMDEYLVPMAFVKQFTATASATTIEMEVDWLRLLDATNMTAADSTRSTHTMNNPTLAALLVSGVEDAFSIQ